jgi:DNA polymerase-4
MGLDEAYLDLSGLSSPRTEMRRLVSRIERETGIGCSVGVGPNKLVAKVASDAEKPRGLVMLTREQACARFAEAPPRLLPGIGPRTAERLAEMGAGTLSRMRLIPEERLIERFGTRAGAYLHRRARFEDDAPLQAVREAVSRSAETTFDADVAEPQQMREALARLAARLCADLGARGLRGRSIGIKVRLDDFSTVTRARSLPDPTCDASLVTRTACELLDAYSPPRPVRLLGVRVAALTSSDGEAPAQTREQLALFGGS